MIRRSATIVALGRNAASVEVAAAPNCASCENGIGCGQGLLFRWFAPRSPMHLRIPRCDGDETGQRVTIGLAPASLASASWLAYGAPLLGLLGGLAIGQWAWGDAGAAALGLTGAALAIHRVRRPNRVARELIRLDD